MFIAELKYGDKHIKLKPYNSSAEKNLLMAIELYEYTNVDDVLENLKEFTDIEDISILSENEKRLILLKLRGISVGTEIPLKYKCQHCGVPNDTVIDIEHLYDDKNKSDIKDQYKELTDENFQEFVDYDVDELELEEYDEKFNYVKDNIVEFKFEKEIKCYKCEEPTIFDISDNKYIIDNLSEDTLMALYKTYSDLIFFSHYTKQDVDSMLPFERTIFIGLINSTKEELSK